MRLIKKSLVLLSLTMLVISNSVMAQTTKIFGNIRYNHVSPHVEIKGVNPLNKDETKNRPHFIFSYNNNHQLSKIINKSFNIKKKHHLASFGVFKVVFTYEKNKETRVFFDTKDQPMANIKGVFKEIYQINNDGFKHQLNFYDKNNEPMESRWNISEYRWQQHNDLVIENRFNLKADKQALSPYFPFNTTGIKYDQSGNPHKHFNLNDQLQVVNNEAGIAYYQDQYDKDGIHTKYSYFNQNDKIVNNEWGFAYAINNYDQLGNYIDADRYDIDGNKQQSSRLVKNNLTSSDIDKKEITRISLGYLVALQQLSPELMKEVMHTELSKHFISTSSDGTQKIRPTTYKQMIDFAETWNKDGTRFPPNPSNKAVILDSYNNMASVKLISDNWYEYLHLLKINGQWKIKNLIWDYNKQN